MYCTFHIISMLQRPVRLANATRMSLCARLCADASPRRGSATHIMTVKTGLTRSAVLRPPADRTTSAARISGVFQSDGSVMEMMIAAMGVMRLQRTTVVSENMSSAIDLNIFYIDIKDDIIQYHQMEMSSTT